jgi:hypothetical protein
MSIGIFVERKELAIIYILIEGVILHSEKTGIFPHMTVLRKVNILSEYV